VTDVIGKAVTTTETDANGAYVFANLPVGSYTVTVTDPSGLVPTTTGAGTTATDSSTGFATSLVLSVDGASDLTLDFGFRDPKVAVGNLVWFDSDNDGIQDSGEPGIAGVTLSITDALGNDVIDVFGNVVPATTTDAAGRYLFDNLPFGSYKVVVTNPVGYSPTVALVGADRSTDSSTGEATSSMLSAEGESDLTLDFGYTAPRVSVGNLVWFDTNNDGVQGLDEPGIAGVTLSITKMDGTPVTSVLGTVVGPVTTDSTGQYLFDFLPPGQYKVSAVTPNGFVATLSGSGSTDADSASGFDASINLTTDGDADMTLDFGFYPVSVSVGDFVWFDSNANGVQDSGELGIAGVTLSITKADGSPVTDVVGNPVTAVTSDEDGRYLFDNLPPGRYRVACNPPMGYAATGTDGGDVATDSSTGSALSMNLLNNEDVDMTLDFGFRLPRVSVGDFVWLDTDKDGVQDPDESGLAGVTVSITKSDGSPAISVFGGQVDSTTTDAAGRYAFAFLPLGSYKVSIVKPAGLVATQTGIGVRETDSSDGFAMSLELRTDGASDSTLDFGFVPEEEVIVGQSMPVTPPRKAMTTPKTSYGFKASDLGRPSEGAKFIPSKTVIAGKSSSSWSKGLRARGGLWSVVDGKVTFTPDPGFVGTSTVKYKVTDTSGQVAESTLTVTVVEPETIPVTGAAPWLLVLVAALLLLVGIATRLVAGKRKHIMFGEIRYSHMSDKVVRKMTGKGVLALVVVFSALLAPSPIGSIRNANAANAAAAPTPGSVPGPGREISLLFGYVLDTTKPPSLSAFTVKVGSSTIAVSGLRYQSTILYLDLASTIYAGESVTVSYTAPAYNNTLTNNALQTTGGNDTESFEDLVIANAALPRLTPNTPAKPSVVAGEESATISVVAPASGRTPTSYTVTASPGGKTCTISGSSGSCTITGLTSGTAYTFTTVAKNASGDSVASDPSDAVTVLAKFEETSRADVPDTSTPAVGVSPAGPSWDIEPATDSETDSFTEGYLPDSFPGTVIITDEFGFVVDAKGGIKPKIRMKNYSGLIRMSLSATYAEAGKTKKYKCKFASFGTKRKIAVAKWRWYTAKKPCVLPSALVTAIRGGTATLATTGKWSRVWSTTGQKKRPEGSKIIRRNLKFTVRAKR